MYHIKNEHDMRAFGERLGSLLHGDETIELVGDVGAGKTTLVKGIASGLGVIEDVQSPSFTISRTYDARDTIQLAHYDFYRLDDAGIMSDELREAADTPNTIVIIEWAEIVANILPFERITIHISPTQDDGRSVKIEAHGKDAQTLVENI